ncbi:MAG TPA: RodZ domain-containing protein [Immundisolibacter sp.]|nr:RodZ domain-containing protein [Immundisolibacter sp.]
MDVEHDAAPAAAASIGEQLRQARLGRGWSTAEAANRLRLRAALIEALEAGDYAPFGAATYARGQLRNYAILLGLDKQALLRDFRPAPADGHTKTLRRAPELHPGRPRLVRVGGLLVVAASAVLAAIWAGAGREPPAADSAPTAVQADSSVVPAEPPRVDAVPESPPPVGASADSPSASADPIVATEAQPAAAEPAPPPGAGPQFGADASDVAGQGEAELRLRSRAVSWVEVTDHAGQRLVYELVSPGPERTVRGQPPLRVLLGNAPAVDVFYNGEPVTLPADQHVVRMTLGTQPPQAAAASSGTPPSGAAPPATTP